MVHSTGRIAVGRMVIFEKGDEYYLAVAMMRERRVTRERVLLVLVRKQMPVRVTRSEGGADNEVKSIKHIFTA